MLWDMYFCSSGKRRRDWHLRIYFLPTIKDIHRRSKVLLALLLIKKVFACPETVHNWKNPVPLISEPSY